MNGGKAHTARQRQQVLLYSFCFTILVLYTLIHWRFHSTITVIWSPHQGRALHLLPAAHLSLPESGSKLAGSACSIKREYVSSELEQAWLNNVGSWQASYCSSLHHTEHMTQAWLKAQAVYDAALQQQGDSSHNPVAVLAEQQVLDTRIFSKFIATVACSDGSSSRHVTWIEPLAHGLRHPNALCSRGTTVFNRTYLMPAHISEVTALANSKKSTCKGRDCQAIYFDLGASLLQPGPAEAGQGWFFHTYAKQGIAFDRYLLWEAYPILPTEVFKNVPKAELEKYQFYNIPVTADTQDEANPINILKRVAQPGDFVVFKLDIDNYKIEAALMAALLDDPDTLALIDEFYHEDHVNFSEMMDWWDWNKQYDPHRSLADSYQQFLKLRQLGIRAHPWV